MAKSAALLVLALAAGAMATDISFGKCPTASNALQNFQAGRVGRPGLTTRYSPVRDMS